jgi:hypothetical protein
VAVPVVAAPTRALRIAPRQQFVESAADDHCVLPRHGLTLRQISDREFIDCEIVDREIVDREIVDREIVEREIVERETGGRACSAGSIHC